MKHKSVSTIAAILCGCVIAFGAVALVLTMSSFGGKTQGEDRFPSFLAQFQKNLNALTIDIRGSVVDEDGRPLKDVDLEIFYTKPDLGTMAVHNIQEYEQRVISGDFKVKKKGFDDVELQFYKSGYYPETFRFHGGFGMGENEENTLEQRDLCVVLEKRSQDAEIDRISHRDLEYDLERKRKTYCDLSDFAAASFGSVMSGRKLEEEEEWEEEEEEGLHARMVTITVDQKPSTRKYLELDFLRDEHGGIVTREFPGVVDNKGEVVKYPAVYIFRLHSDDPEDGMIVMEDGGYLHAHPFDGNQMDPREYEKKIKEERSILTEEKKNLRPLERRFVAPKDGYTLKEVSIPVEEMIRIQGDSVTWHGGYRWMWIRCGNHYGKFSVTNAFARITSGVGYGALNKDFRALFHLELYMNMNPGDTDLRN